MAPGHDVILSEAKDLRPEQSEIPHCVRDDNHASGYLGRTGIYELLVLDEGIRDALIHRASSSELRTMAVARGMRTLKQDGLGLIRSGMTTTEEVLRVGGE